MKTLQKDFSNISEEEFYKSFRETFYKGLTPLDDSDYSESLYFLPNQTLIDQLKTRRNKKFGKAVKIESGKESPNEDIISFIKAKKSIDIDQLIAKFSIFPTDAEKNLVASFISRNPMGNIRKRKQDYLLRMEINKKKLYKKFKNLEKAKKVRNILFFYLICKENKFSFLAKRNMLSTIKRIKGKIGNRKNHQNYEEIKENEIQESLKNDNLKDKGSQYNGKNLVYF